MPKKKKLTPEDVLTISAGDYFVMAFKEPKEYECKGVHTTTRGLSPADAILSVVPEGTEVVVNLTYNTYSSSVSGGSHVSGTALIPR